MLINVPMRTTELFRVGSGIATVQVAVLTSEFDMITSACMDPVSYCSTCIHAQNCI